MKRSVGLFFPLLTAAALSTLPRSVGARPNRTPAPIKLTYRGGPLLPHVRVATLFWGSGWSGSPLPAYFGSFFRLLFADGRYMANLAQYSERSYPISVGTFGGSATDSQPPPTKLPDAQIQTEIRAQIAAGHLPKPDENTVYFVFTPPHVVVYDSYGANSVRDFYSYHDYSPGSEGFPYAVIAYDNTLPDPEQMTSYASHELAEMVTDPRVDSDRLIGWYDDHYGEVADIVPTLYDEGRIGDSDLLDELDGSDGTAYVVQKVWSVKDNAPVAFAKSAK